MNGDQFKQETEMIEHLDHLITPMILKAYLDGIEAIIKSGMSITAALNGAQECPTMKLKDNLISRMREIAITASTDKARSEEMIKEIERDWKEGRM
jgi:hypothetical protein